MPWLKLPKITPKSNVQIPTPKMVAEYERVSHEHWLVVWARIEKELDSNKRYAFCGMWIAFVISLLLIGSAIYMGVIGNNKAVAAFMATTAVGLATSFLGARR